MSADIGPGDWVERTRTTVGALRAGDIVRVGRVLADQLGCSECRDGMGLIIEAAPHPYGKGSAWCSCGFRPISGGAKGMFDHLKEPVQRLTEDA